MVSAKASSPLQTTSHAGVERVYLLKHLLRMVLEPNHKQHPDIQKLNLNVAKLEEATYEALSGFFMDGENRNNTKKKPYLKELIYIAKNEERYRNGEIGRTAAVCLETRPSPR